MSDQRAPKVRRVGRTARLRAVLPTVTVIWALGFVVLLVLVLVFVLAPALGSFEVVRTPLVPGVELEQTRSADYLRELWGFFIVASVGLGLTFLGRRAHYGLSVEDPPVGRGIHPDDLQGWRALWAVGPVVGFFCGVMLLARELGPTATTLLDRSVSQGDGILSLVDAVVVVAVIVLSIVGYLVLARRLAS